MIRTHLLSLHKDIKVEHGPVFPPQTTDQNPVISLKQDIHSDTKVMMCRTHIIERGTVPEHEQDVIDELLHCEVVERVALVQFPADH